MLFKNDTNSHESAGPELAQAVKRAVDGLVFRLGDVLDGVAVFAANRNQTNPS